MKTIAEVAYHLAFQNSFQRYLQINDVTQLPVDQIEDDKTFEYTNCIQKTQIDFEKATTLPSEQKFDIIYIAGRGTTREKIHQRIEFAESRLAEGGAIMFNFANATKPEDGESWQEVARLRCKKNSFICVIPQVAQCCAVYRPGLRSHVYAAEHLPRFDKFEYLQSNRALLLNIISDTDFETLIRFI